MGYILGFGGCDYCQKCAPNAPCAAPAPVITSASTASGSTGSAFSYTITATNTPTSFLIIAGTFIPGTSLNTSTGVLSGTPPSGYAGTYVMTLQATNACGSGTMVLTVTITGTGGGGGGIDCDCVGISIEGTSTYDPGTCFDETQTLGSALTCDTLVELAWNVFEGTMAFEVRADGTTIYTGPTITASDSGSVLVTIPTGTTVIRFLATCGDEGGGPNATLECP